MNSHSSKLTPRMLLAILSLGAAAVPSAASAASVVGTVRDAVTLDPVPGFNLTLHVINPDSVALSTTSGPGGAYAISGAPGGNEIYVLTGSGPVYAGYYARVAVPDPELTFDVLLDSLQVPIPGDPVDSSAVFGRVMTESGGGTQAVAGATVILSTGGVSYAGLTDPDGRYEMVVPPGMYGAQVDANGFLPIADSGLDVGSGGLTYDAFLTHSTTGIPPRPVDTRVRISAIRPNPVRLSTEIHYVLADGGAVGLTVYDLSGRRVSHVVSGWRAPGPQVARLHAVGLEAGIYFCLLEVEGHSASKRFAVLP